MLLIYKLVIKKTLILFFIIFLSIFSNNNYNRTYL